MANLTSGEILDVLEDTGAFIKAVDVIRDEAVTTYPGLLDDIETTLSTNDRQDVLSGTPDMFDSFQDSLIGIVDRLRDKVNTRFTNRPTLLEKLPVTTGASARDVLLEFIKEMGANSQTVKASEVTLGSVTAATNHGDGTVLLSKVLDGITSPGTGLYVAPSQKGTLSELCRPEAFTLTCFRDAESGGTPEGQEVFQWDGKQASRGPFDWRPEGSGQGPSVPTLNSTTTLLNKDFELFSTTNVPDNWTVTGTTSTVGEEATSVNVYRGTKSLKITGNGATATLGVKQVIPAAGLTPNRLYLVALYVKGEASTVAGALTVQFEGTGYTPGGSEKVEMDAAALSAATSFTLKYFWVLMPATIPSDFGLVIKVTGTLTSAKRVWIDSVAFGPPVWHNGHAVAVIAGATQFLSGDRFTYAVANDDAGKFQRFFRRHFGMQLPSVDDASETIDDSLAGG